MENHAVLTGDLVGSTAAGMEAVEKAMACLAQAAGMIAYGEGKETRFTRFRGDGWQIYLDFPGLALRSCLFLRASLKASGSPMDTRISVGIGSVASVGTKDLSDAHGDAFLISGHGLDEMPRSRRLAIFQDHGTAPFFDAVFDLADFQTEKWSQAQAEAVAIALCADANGTVEDMASTLGISRQAMQARLKGAGFHALQQAMWAFQSRDYDKGAAP